MTSPHHATATPHCEEKWEATHVAVLKLLEYQQQERELQQQQQPEQQREQAATVSSYFAYFAYNYCTPAIRKAANAKDVRRMEHAINTFPILKSPAEFEKQLDAPVHGDAAKANIRAILGSDFKIDETLWTTANASDLAAKVIGFGSTLAPHGTAADPNLRNFLETHFKSITAKVSFMDLANKLIFMAQEELAAYDAAGGVTTAAPSDATSCHPLDAKRAELYRSWLAAVQSKDQLLLLLMRMVYQREDVVSLTDPALPPVTPVNLQQVLLNSTQPYYFPDAIFNATLALVDAAGTIEPALEELVNDAELQDRAFAKLRIGMLGSPQLQLSELAKLSSSKNEQWFVDACNLSKHDAALLAVYIYKYGRKQQPNFVEAKTKLEQAMFAIERRDSVIDLAHCTLDARTLCRYTDAVIKFNTAIDMDISRNNIHAEGSVTIAAMLPKLQRIRTLSLCGNNIQSSGISRVLAASKGTSLKVLDLSQNHGGPSCAEFLAEHIENLSLEKLCINYNQIGRAGARHISTMLDQASPALKEIQLDGNEFGDEGILEIAKGLTQNTARGANHGLRCIHLSDNLARQFSTVTKLGAALGGSVTAVRFQLNGPFAEGVDEIRKALKGSGSSKRTVVL